MTNERLQVNVRLERDLVDELDEMARAESLDRTELARRLLRDGLRRERLELAIDRYRAGEVSPGRAAEMARVSLYEMIDRIHQEGIPYELDPAELDRLRPPTGASARVATAVREDPAPYGAGSADGASGIEEARAQFRPERVRWLFVGESSPAGGTHFYRANSNLFRATQAAFTEALGAGIPSGAAFLHYFRDHGYWLVDLADRPVNWLHLRERSVNVAGGQRRLAESIRETRPARIVVVKASIAETVREAAAAAGFTGDVLELPFPVRQWRAVYVRQLAAALRTER